MKKSFSKDLIHCLLLVFLIGASACNKGKDISIQGDKVTLQASGKVLDLNLETASFSISNFQGEVLLPAHELSGILFSSHPDSLPTAGKVVDYQLKSNTVEGVMRNQNLETVEFKMSIEDGWFQVQVWSESSSPMLMEVRTAPMSPVYGLGDHGSYSGKTELSGFENEHFINDKAEDYNWNHFRFVSTFAVFPSRNVAQVLFEKGEKRIVINEKENKMGVGSSKSLNAYYFFGEPQNLYQSYKEVREQEGYPSLKPKFDFFELGYEAFGSLGWNTFQSSVQDDIQTYLNKGYPIHWAVVGSGFWKGERRKPSEGSTTAFGIWDSVAEQGRKDGLPNPRYSNVKGMKEFFSQRKIKLLLGSRINFKALEKDGGNYTPKNDGDFVLEALKKNFFVADQSGKPALFHVNFPIGKTYLLDGEKPDAVKWFVDQYERWGVDGIKEDLMFQDGRLLNNDAKQNKVNEEFMARGNLVMVRNAAYSVPGDVLRMEDTKYGFDQDRTPINALAYAYSGAGNVYPDIVAGKYLVNPLTEDQKRYFVRNSMLAAVMPVMSLGYGPWHMENKDYEAVVKKAVDLHVQMVPFIYSEIVRGFETGFPYAMTPLPLAFPEDERTYFLADSLKRQYSWMIGESLLAAPIFGNDYASAQTRDLYLPEGKWMDWESGDILLGDSIYSDYSFPDGKIPLFVGGKDCIVLRKEGKLWLYYFPLNFKGESYDFYHPDGVSRSRVTSPTKIGSSYEVSSSGGKFEKMGWDSERQGYYFELHPGKNYQIQAINP